MSGDISDKQVYLSGPVTHADDFTRNRWRTLLTDKAPFEVVNPCDEYDEDWESERLVKGCFGDITQSDGVIVGDTGHRSPGTWREVEFATWVDVPVVVWDIDSPREDFVEMFPVVETCEAAIEEIQMWMEESR